jgi:hypothetical protein
MLGKNIGIAIEIEIEIENNYNTIMFDPDPDSDFDPENTFEKHQSLKLMKLVPLYEYRVLYKAKITVNLSCSCA